MSAFLVDDKTMHRALMGVAYAQNRPGFDPDELTALGRKWFALNIFALKERYGNRAFEPDEPVYEPSSYRFEWPGERHPADYYKAMSCLHYQCSEGEAMEHEDYAAMTQALAALADRIVSDLPQYQAAEW